MTGPEPTSGRRDTGGRIDRSRRLTFTFDGQTYAGHPGDTLASALLGAGVRRFAHSIHLRRPRGVLSAGVEEPNALVEVVSGTAGGSGESMLRATQVELYDGLRARSLHGRGILHDETDTTRYDHRHVHADVVVVGAGPAGLAAALAAGRTGARVVLVDDQPEPGGDLLSSTDSLDARPAADWVATVHRELASLPEVRFLPRTTALGIYDHGLVVAAERRTEHLGAAAPSHRSRQRLWHVRAARIVLATGAHERPLVFVDNDLPGVMLASAARTYANRYGVRPGERAVVATTDDRAYAVAIDLLDAGVEVATVVDTRRAPGPLAAGARERGIEVVTGAAVTAGLGDGTLTGVLIDAVADGIPTGAPRRIDADLLAVSGGWNPVVQLFTQAQGRVRFDETLQAYLPDTCEQDVVCAGAAAGIWATAAAIRSGADAGVAAAVDLGFPPGDPVHVPDDGAVPTAPTAALWVLPAADEAARRRQFVDLQRDATVADIERATDAGLRSPEHVKRYTTIGTANDQGRTSGVVANGVLAQLLGRPTGAVGTTTYRPPYVPVLFSLLAGRDRGPLSDPIRTTAMHPWHLANGAVFEDVGQWKRPRYYPRVGEDMDAAVLRECAATREGVGMMDASTLGKIDVRGPDAGIFLDRIYTNMFSTLQIGSCRYGLMCGADGMVMDDGVTARLAEDRYLMTTTTGGAAKVFEWLEEWLQTEWPELRVHLTSVTEQWATTAVVGPRSRDVLAALAPDLELDAADFPFMALRDTQVAGVPARVFRISFSGELAYEINVPWDHGLHIWESVAAAGEPYGITPYGTEAMHVLRAEKGFVIVGQDTDGTVTPIDLGMGWVVSKKKRDFVGKRSLRRPDTTRDDRKQLVGLLPVDPQELVPEGAQLVEELLDAPPVPMVGHVTSSYRSAALGRTFALALVESGRQRIGQRLLAPLVDRTIEVDVTEPIFYDPEGERRDG